jgi:hypothetical protein
VSGATLAGKVFRGYAIAGSKLGRVHDWYRPVGPTAPLAAANKRETLPASFDARPSYNFTIPALSGDFMRYGLFDATRVQVGDFFVGPAGTLFVAGMPDYQPLPCIACDGVVSMRRLGHPGGFGAVDAPEGPTGEVVIFSGWPAAIVYASRGGGAAAENLPGGSPPPNFEILLPVIPGVSEPPRSGDIITDARGDRFEVAWFDATPLGWRMHARRLLST